MKKIVVVGAGLSGLWLSQKLSENGNHVVLVESRDVAGGRYRRVRDESPFESPDLSFYPGDEKHENFLRHLSERYPEIFSYEVSSHQSLTHMHSEWRDFVGFADDPASSVPALSEWNSNGQIHLQPEISNLVKKLVEEANFEIKLRTEVTHIEVKEGRAATLTLNGSTSIDADEVIFCPPVSQLLELLPAESLKPGTRARLARSSGWTAVFLKLEYDEVISDNSDLRFLLGTGKEFEPAVGRIFPTHSTWMSLVAVDKAFEPDYVTGQIKAIKRVLKRHCPEILEKSKKETLFIQDEAYGDLNLKLKTEGRFAEISNLWLANHRLSPLLGALGELHAAETVLNDLFVAEPHKPVLTDQQL